MTRFCYLSLVPMLLFAPSAWGAIVYVDATPNTDGTDGNTTIDGALVEFGTNATTENSSNAAISGDGMWNYRPNAAAASDNFWETDTGSNASETTAPLITSVELGPGTYNLFGVFRPQGSTHDVSFSLGGLSYTEFTPSNATAAAIDGSDFANPLDVGEIDNSIGDVYLASLGQVTLAATQLVSVYVQGPDRDGVTISAQRTRYEGIGYEQVSAVPEPSSIFLATLGALAIGIRVRQRRASRNPS